MGGFVDPFLSSPAWPQPNRSETSVFESVDPIADALEAYDTAGRDFESNYLMSASHGVDTASSDDLEFNEQDKGHAGPILQPEFPYGSRGCSSADELHMFDHPLCLMNFPQDDAPALCSSNGENSAGSSHFPLQCVHPMASKAPPFDASSSIVDLESHIIGLEKLPSCYASENKSDQEPYSSGDGHQMWWDSSHFNGHEEELSAMYNAISSLASELQSSTADTAILPASHQVAELTGVNHGIQYAGSAQSQAFSSCGNGSSGTSKPRMRARRGQATDPHSIAERLRREKISDRMKNLQELVPNSNKTDKASMLDEIIDYIKFLQMQVKALSISRLGIAEAVAPVLSEKEEPEGCDPILPSKQASRSSLRHSECISFAQPEPQDNAAFEQEVIKLLDTNITAAMQYLQNKGLCLMPVALASAISDHKGSCSAAVSAGNNGRPSCKRNNGETVAVNGSS